MTTIRIASARGDLGIAAYEREIAEHSESQRAMVGANIATMKQGTRTDLGQICTKSAAEAAALVNVSERSVKSGRSVKDSGTPELKGGPIGPPSLEDARFKVPGGALNSDGPIGLSDEVCP